MKNKDEAIINMSVKDDSDFLSPYSAKNKPVISADVADFLENSAKNFHPKQDVIINVYGDCISQEEKPVYDSAIRNYFALKITDSARDVKRKGVISLIFTIIGVISLAVMFILSARGLNEIWTECVDIFAWVFLWEAVDQFFIERNGVIFQMRRCLSFYNAKINFLPSDSDAQSPCDNI